MAGPSSASTLPALPLDILYNIGLALASDPIEEAREYMKSEYDPGQKPRLSALRHLTYLSHATKGILEPLLYRHITFTRPEQVTLFFITLIQRSELRQHVQYIASFAELTGTAVRKRQLPACKRLWSSRCPSDKAALLRILDKNGLHGLAWAASLLERTKGRFMFNADFKHDGILELIFASIVFLTPNVTTFIWLDTNTNPKAMLLDLIFQSGIAADLPLMPNLQVLHTEKAAFNDNTQAAFFTPHINLWDNLKKLYLNDMDFDDEFIKILVRGDFKDNRPVKELYVRCVSGGEHPGDMNSFDPHDELPGTQLLSETDPDQDKDKFKAFPNLTLLDVKFAFHEGRALTGSRTLRSFMHAVGAPERILLTGHPMPIKALSTGITHPQLKYLRVKEIIKSAPSKSDSKDNLVAGLNQFWNSKPELVPSLCEIDWDGYKFRREDLEGEDKAVWVLKGEEDWEDDSDDDDDDYDSDDFMDDDDDDDDTLSGFGRSFLEHEISMADLEYLETYGGYQIYD
ncbi:hypothetical protein FSARC_5151 [Fusarium sarcochroum]|uniref:Uncharacterized protein n=1 Tax=Fusarium sarcochroum TaxID=1208366 RepID=A0A8H4U0D2_9HYPO|nr:hypothetical protein FSARC_5151 [Fusarium sarcochroum]